MKMLSFSSYTAIWFSSFPEAIIAYEMQRKNHEVVYITPGKEFAGKSNIINENILRKEFCLSGYQLGSVLSSRDRQEIRSIMNRINQNNFEKLIIDGINIGKIALYEVLISSKKINAHFTKAEWRMCLAEIQSTLTSFYACRKILKKENPDILIVYNALYSVNRVWVEYAKLHRITPYFLACGGNLSDMSDTILIAKNHSIYYSKHLKNLWAKFQKTPISKKMVQYVTNHYLELLKAKNPLVYSSPRSTNEVNIRNFFNIRDNQKILTATMSSYDELFSAQYTGAWDKPKNSIFHSQEEWIRNLIKYVQNRKDLFLLIRVHPREFPNNRNAKKSEHIKILKSIFSDLPPNIKVNWPRDLISVYDLAEVTSVFLNAWSSVGVEMSLLGIPVVIYSDELVSYPSSLNYLAKTKQDYFSQIELALKDGWSYSKIKQTYRWLALNYARTTLKYRQSDNKLSQQTSIGQTANLSNYIYSMFSPKIRTNISQILSYLPIFGVGNIQQTDCRSYLSARADFTSTENILNQSLNSLADLDTKSHISTSVTQEDRAIRQQVKQIYHALYGKQTSDTHIIGDKLKSNLRRLFS